MIYIINWERGTPSAQCAPNSMPAYPMSPITTARQSCTLVCSCQSGPYPYYDTAYGSSIEDRDGFVKVLAHQETREILGRHIIGSEASIQIH